MAEADGLHPRFAGENQHAQFFARFRFQHGGVRIEVLVGAGRQDLAAFHAAQPGDYLGREAGLVDLCGDRKFRCKCRHVPSEAGGQATAYG